MKPLKFLCLMFITMFLCPSAWAWNCDKPGQIRVQVPNGTVGSGHGNGDGQVYTVESITFQCVSPPGQGLTQSQDQNQNQTQAQNNLQIAASEVSNENTNNNTNDNTNLNYNGASAEASAGASAGSSATSGGNNISVAAPRFPVTTAYAPQTQATVTCFKGVGVGIQTTLLGGSFGGGKIDEGCDERELARSYFLAGSRLAGCKMLVNNKRSKQAGVTLEDCMEVEPVFSPLPVEIVPAPEKPEPQPIVITVTPAPVVIQPAAPPVPPIVQPEPIVPKPIVRKKVTKTVPKSKPCNCSDGQQYHQPIGTH